MLTCLPVLGLRAQYDVHFGNYEAVETFYNPAAAGDAMRLNVVGAYALQMADFENSPQTMFFGADMPLPVLGGHHALGAQLLNDRIGLFTNQSFSLQYAYHGRIFGGNMGVGLSLGFLSEKFDGSKVEFVGDEADDPAIPSAAVQGSVIDIGAGLRYELHGYYVGIGAHHLNRPKVLLGERNEMQIDASYNFMAGGNISTKIPLLKLQPSVMLMTDGTAFRADVAVKACYHNDDKMLYGGLGYSPTNSVSAFLGGTFHGILLGYSYEYYTSNLSFSSGSHELTIGYQTELNIYKKGKNKHKSVRYL